jgi:hypothetical protein
MKCGDSTFFCFVMVKRWEAGAIQLSIMNLYWCILHLFAQTNQCAIPYIFNNNPQKKHAVLKNDHFS